MPTTTPVDLSDSTLWRNGFPDELFAELRRDRPLFHHELTDGVAKTVKRDFWMATKHRHAQRIHRDTDSFTATDGPLIQGVGVIGSAPTIINMDPPDLLKRRRVMSHAFTPKAIGKLEDGIRRRAAGMVDRLLTRRRGRLDRRRRRRAADVGHRRHHRHSRGRTGRRSSTRSIASSRWHRRTTPSPSRTRWNCSGRSSPMRFELTAEKRRNPTDDIWSTLTSAVVTDENGEQLSIPANELEIFFFVIAFAGSDTTKNALASGLQAFVANPEQIERYREDEAVRSSAVEEVLRWASPVTFWTRSTKVDVEMDGMTIPKGERVVAMLRSANRDEEVFDNPFAFDIGRAENPHVTFGGGGPHHCLGAMLARAEIRAVLDELLCRADEISLGSPKVAYPNLTNNMTIFDGMPISLKRR